MIPKDRQRYIRSMSLCTPKKFKVNRGLETRSCLESPRHARIWSGVACSAVHFGKISKHLELSEKVKLLICPLRKRICKGESLMDGEKGQLLWSKTGAPKIEDCLSSDARINP
ncbi:hypothetical protein AVEN_214356-1 [Araneus ventricosus]|uniref:Uncharacterized protein n=1 Tax=Araneus ventricosus TaxID=182803 RepID=A0A4Y2VTV3_ARAVE|nr:hypothetical protein AVEN_214356-1 [Araneus ventricosus]